MQSVMVITVFVLVGLTPTSYNLTLLTKFVVVEDSFRHYTLVVVV